MERVEAGMLAWSRAGHDLGALYVIMRTEGDFAWLADGRLKTVEKPKKKRLKHIQVIRRQTQPAESEAKISNEEVKFRIKEYKRTSGKEI